MGAKYRCPKCGDIIQSKYRHDFQKCKCGACFVDGGDDYTRLGGQDDAMPELVKDEHDD